MMHGRSRGGRSNLSIKIQIQVQIEEYQCHLHHPMLVMHIPIYRCITNYLISLIEFSFNTVKALIPTHLLPLCRYMYQIIVPTHPAAFSPCDTFLHLLHIFMHLFKESVN